MAVNRFYLPKSQSRSHILAQGIKCVFISYQQEDKDQAKKVADYLEKAGIDIYYDQYDSELRIHHENNDPKKVTASICNGINNSSHMMVVVSPNTIHSSWVPFEIGYGYEKTDLYVLCLKGIPKGGLPEYIRTVPIIRDLYDLQNRMSDFSPIKNGLSESVKLKASYSSSINPLYDVMDSIITDQY